MATKGAASRPATPSQSTAITVLLVGVVSIGFCAVIFFFGRIPARWSSKLQEPTEASARQVLKKELDKWVSGEDLLSVIPYEAPQAVPPSGYEIQAFTSIDEFRSPTLVETFEIRGYPQPGSPTFRAVVKLDFISRANTPLTKMYEYRLFFLFKEGIDRNGRWYIHSVN